MSNNTFIEKSKIIHKNKYDYTLVEYKNNKTKVKIICLKHGVFEQVAGSHLSGNGCIKCARLERMTLTEFIQKSKKIHGDKYDYSLSEYKNSKTNIKIICPIHGIFEQTSNSHLNGAGCSFCSKNKLTTKTFKEKSIKNHGDKYDYNLVNYKNINTKVKIVCPKHGIFEQTPAYHLSSGGGCTLCNKPNIFIEKSKKIHGDKYDYNLIDYKDNKTKG